jgi:putative ABC transport system permease protein
VRHLLRLVSLRHLTATPGRTIATVIGIALGIAVVFAIDIVNGTVMASFRGTIESISGKTTLSVGEGTGVPEELLETVKAVPGVLSAVPVIEESVRDMRSGTQLAVLAIDTLGDSEVREYDVTANDVKIEDDLAFLNDPRAVLVTDELAGRIGIKVGDTLKLETSTGEAQFTVRGTLAARGPARAFGGDLLLMDVYAAQIAFERGRRFDRIDVVAAPGVTPGVLQQRLEQSLKGKLPIARPERRSEDAERIVAGFKLGLSLASFVAIFVGAFIVYNALAIAVAQRRREIGILRALGTRRSQILAVFLAEGALLGGVGALLGLGLGYALAKNVLQMVGSTVSALYLQVKPVDLVVTGEQVVFALNVGLTAAALASLMPAARAAGIEPVVAMHKHEAETSGAVRLRKRSLLAGITLLACAVVLAVIAHFVRSYKLGYAVSTFLSLSVALLAPWLAARVGQLARRLSAHIGPSARLGAIAFERNAGRSGIAIAALGMALASVVNASVFLESMKHTTLSWFERSVRADLFVFAGKNVSARMDHPLPEALGESMRGLPGVEFVDGYRMVRKRYKDQPIHIASHDLLGRSVRKYDEMPVVEGDYEEALPAIARGEAIAASESFIHQFKAAIGDSITLDTPSGPASFRIALVYVDYSSDLGVLLTTRDVYARLFMDTTVDSYGIYLAKDADAPKLRNEVAQRWGKQHGLLVIGNVDYKRELLALIDRSFLLTRAVELIAIFVAILGIVNTLLVNVLDRRTELGALKAIGAVRAQLTRMFIMEASLLSFCAAIVGVLMGGAFSLYITEEILPLQLGWRVSWRFSPFVIVETFAVAQAVALIAALWPMRAATKIDVRDALQYE